MADVQRTRAAILALFADNVTGQISAQDLRDFMVTLMNTEFANEGDFWAQPSPNYVVTDKTGRGWMEYSQTAGEALNFGNVLYKTSVGFWKRADVNASTTLPGIAMAMDSYASNATTVQVLRLGVVYNSAWSVRWSEKIGKRIFLMSGLPGSLSDQLQVSVQVLGLYETNGVLRFDPSWAVGTLGV